MLKKSSKEEKRTIEFFQQIYYFIEIVLLAEFNKEKGLSLLTHPF